jgi:hypothetical protein
MFAKKLPLSGKEKRKGEAALPKMETPLTPNWGSTTFQRNEEKREARSEQRISVKRPPPIARTKLKARFDGSS